MKRLFDVCSSQPTLTTLSWVQIRKNLYIQAKDLFRPGGFNLRKFLTSSSKLQQQIDCAEGIEPTNSEAHGSKRTSHLDETYAQATLGTPSTKGIEEHKILGVPWNPDSDSLIFDISELAQLANDLHRKPHQSDREIL